MYREKLLKEERRRTYRAVVSRPGIIHGKKSGPTILLLNVRPKYKSNIVTDHIWLRYSRQFAKLNELVPGDVLEFDATLKEYKHLYRLKLKHC